jgi:hypothetical protein
MQGRCAKQAFVAMAIVSALLVGSGILIIVGPYTPIAATVVAVTEICGLLTVIWA